MIVTREVISALGRAIVGNVDDFIVDKDLKFREVIKSYNGIEFRLSGFTDGPFIEINHVYVAAYVVNTDRLCATYLSQLSEYDIKQLISFINKQKELGALKEQKRFEDDLKKFRDVIYERETTGV